MPRWAMSSPWMSATAIRWKCRGATAIELPAGVIDSLRRITNVRPALATPLWISGQIRRYAESAALEAELKKVWDDLCDQFLQLDFVREQDKAFKLDIVDALELVLKISKRTSFQTLDDLVLWVHEKLRENDRSLAEHALQEPAFLDNSARFVVYGHTHHHEIVPLDSDGEPPNEQNQFYINSGTWRSYYDLAVKESQGTEIRALSNLHLSDFLQRW